MDRKRSALAILVLISLSIPGVTSHQTQAHASASMAQTSAAGIEPRAGTWKTWVLSSGSQLRLPAPPDRAATEAEIRELKTLASQRDVAALDRISYWDAGAPGYRWVEIAIERLLQEPRTTFQQRGLALVNVAVYDATIAAWDSKYTHNRPRPSEFDSSLTTVLSNPRSPSYPSEHAVAAGAASAVLAYLFPSEAQTFMDKADEAVRSRLLAGVQYPSDVAAGLELGRQVAGLVIERARADGSDAPWTGTVPTGPGLWNGTNPITPQAANWKTWVLSSGDQFRPGPPPAYDSPQKQAELDEIKNFNRTFQTNAAAFFAQTNDGVLGYWYLVVNQRLFEYKLDANPPRAARAYALMSVANYDGLTACWDAKFTYWAIRPFQLDPDVKTLFPTPNHPSYPAAHGCVSGSMSAMIAYLFPREADSINAKAEENAESRIWAGIHYRSDVVAGLALGRDVAQAVIEWAESDGSQ